MDMIKMGGRGGGGLGWAGLYEAAYGILLYSTHVHETFLNFFKTLTPFCYFPLDFAEPAMTLCNLPPPPSPNLPCAPSSAIFQKNPHIYIYSSKFLRSGRCLRLQDVFRGGNFDVGFFILGVRGWCGDVGRVRVGVGVRIVGGREVVGRWW